MKAVQFHEYGGPEVLCFDEVAKPEPQAGEIRIAVRAAGVNPLDWKLRAGYMKDFMPLPLPSGVGFDASGLVDAVGEGVTGVEVGDAVFGQGHATVAEYAVLTGWAAKPEGLSFEEAAGFGTPVETASRVLAQLGVAAGQTLLVSGGAGGVGTAVLQLARNAGIHTIATASEAKHDYLRSFSAEPTTYGSGLVERVRALAPNGVDAALDLVGSGIIAELAELTGDPAKVLSIVDFSAPAHGAQVSFEPSHNASAWLAKAAEQFTAGTFRMPVEQVFSFDRIADAQIKSAEGRVTGRLAVVIE